MSDTKLVWTDTEGDLRKKQKPKKPSSAVNDKNIVLGVRRLTAGKGRTVIEISGLPKNKSWCQNLAKTLKKKMGVGGTYKNDFIEIHGEKIDQVTEILDSQNLKWKKTGG